MDHPYTATTVGAPNADGTPITNPAPLSFRTTEYGWTGLAPSPSWP